MTIVVVVILFAAAAYLTFYACYLLLLLVASLIPSKKFAVEGKQTTRFGIVIPAHDEEMFLGRLLSALPFAELSQDALRRDCGGRQLH